MAEQFRDYEYKPPIGLERENNNEKNHYPTDADGVDYGLQLNQESRHTFKKYG